MIYGIYENTKFIMTSPDLTRAVEMVNTLNKIFFSNPVYTYKELPIDISDLTFDINTKMNVFMHVWYDTSSGWHTSTLTKGLTDSFTHELSYCKLKSIDKVIVETKPPTVGKPKPTKLYHVKLFAEDFKSGLERAKSIINKFMDGENK